VDVDATTMPLSKPTTFSSKRYWIIGIAAFAVTALALGVGLGVGLTRKSSSHDSNASAAPDQNLGIPSLTSTTPTSSLTSSSSSNPTAKPIWQPHVEASWQIVLLNPLANLTVSASIFDIDLFTNNASTIASLHRLGRKVICYFSAGSYEDFRPDASSFAPSDYAKELQGWPGEFWLNTSSPNVRSIMEARLDLAVSKGCDGVDPDNVDGYDNDTGLNLTADSAVAYMTFLSNEAHARGLSIGLKNSARIVESVLHLVEFQVNEQCVEFGDCKEFVAFLEAGKPVFHIEYPTTDAEPNVVRAAKRKEICGNVDARRFSTLLKNMVLDEWFLAC
jgi:hypothetical protein